MSIITIILIAIGLAMDCFAVSTTKGLCTGKWNNGALWMALLFGIFQGGMPLIGYFCGTLFADFFSRFAPWIALILLGFIGGKMIWESLHKEQEGCPLTGKPTKWDLGELLLLAVATSIDALATGVIFIPCPERVWVGVGIIALASFVLSLVGYMIGWKIGKRFQWNMGLIGGIILVGIGIKIFLEGTLCAASAKVEEQHASYPQAEWSQATAILMHTPGEELFYGAIHPYAGLFEYYFDVELAAAEHRHYKDMLREQGIRVYEVSDILEQLPVETLRDLTEQVLVYDVSALSKEDARLFGEPYRQEVLQQMSKADMIRCLLHQPRVVLRPTAINTGVEAVYEDNSLMNLYFTRDQSITTPRGHIMCRMNSVQRAPETRIIEACYQFLGEPAIMSVEGDGRLEGGDYIPAGTVAFIGCGMRTNREGIRQIMAHDAFGHDTVIVVCDHRFWQMQMHLDTHFNIIDRDLCTMVASRFHAQPQSPNYVTADIYARAAGEKEYRLIAQDKGFVELLQERGMEIIPIEEADEMHYANNYLTIAPRHIMAVGNQSLTFQDALQSHGVQVEWVPLENLIKGYGAAHCMTQVLYRQ